MTEKPVKTLMMALGRTHKEWGQHMRKCALEVGIPDSYRLIIMFLSRNPGASQKQLAEFSHKTTAAINQAVKEMLADGYLRKEVDETDQRYTCLYLTDKGTQKAEALRQRLHTSDEFLTSVITAEKEQELIALLDHLCDVIRRDL
ncbi:MAG: MarR family transcriptional regulator [Clostridia bacterium]|nr:MarR family transcriptional regulator [Clostridia bacterium]